MLYYIYNDGGSSMFLSPSQILYIHHYDPEIRMSTEQKLTKNSIHGSVFPKLQVVKKDGFYFTLNDAKLQVYRHLETLGKCGSVEVDKVALKEVPEGIRQLMKAPEKAKRRRNWSDEDVSDTDIQTEEDERSRLQPQDHTAANNDENESFI
ncbi:hypothetical protein MAR_028670 [Mya arenaria]|uniref:Uncharacterized protein n=1 Tax=Mya arenaria TaxID=6604 RepID=A0ABY7DI18_MYAAR|nr:hypothetical protein MAR_028670 [Mya arenaria]